MIISRNKKTITKIIISLLIIVPNVLSGQKISQERIGIKIEKAKHFIIYNKNGKQTNRFSNKKNRPALVYHLDSTGNILEKISYEQPHSYDLRSIYSIESYTYADGYLISSTKSFSDCMCPQEPVPIYQTKYTYNANKKLIKESSYMHDSLISLITYEYDKLGNEDISYGKSISYKKTFNKNKKIASHQQFYKNKLNWEYLFTYTDSTRIGMFQTHYDDGKNHSKQEIRKYNKGKLVEIEEKAISGSTQGVSHKTVIQYNNIGLIEKIDYYDTYTLDTSYTLTSYTKINVQYSLSLNSLLINAINNAILYDY